MPEMVTEPILTDRLVLRSMKQDDAADVWSIWGDYEMGKYLADPYYQDAKVLHDLFVDVDEWEDYSFVAHARDSGAFVGTCSIGTEGPEGTWGFGYCVTRAQQGKGYATEMAKALVDFIYGQGIRDFQGTVAVENVASCRVMEKCGMHVDHESSFKKKGTDIVYPSYIYRMHLD